MARKLKLENITAGFQQIENQVANSIENVGYEELIPAALIDLAEKNTYGKRDKDEDYKELAQQIEAVGLINSLGVIKHDDRYTLFSGERRYNAITKYLHWEKIPCRVFEGVSVNKAQLMLHIANGGREFTAGQKLELYEEYNTLLLHMKASGELTGGLQKNLAELLNISERQVRTYRQISETLSEQEKAAVIAGEVTITEAHAAAAMRSAQNEPLPPIKATQAKTDPIDEGNFDWEPILSEAIKQAYDCKALYRCYVLDVATPKEAAKEVLKPRNGYHGQSVQLSGSSEHCTCTSARVEITYNGISKCFTYMEVDKVIRQLIRDGLLLTKAEATKVFQAFMKEL